MRISVEVDLEPHEFQLANELLRTLNTLTDHVKVRSKGGAGAPPGAAPQAAPQAPQLAVPTPAPVPTPMPAAAPPAGPVPASLPDARRAFTELLSSLSDRSRLNMVAAELGRLFSACSLPAQQLQDEFLEAFFAVTFDPKNIPAEHGVAPYMHVLPRLPDSAKEYTKGKVISKVLQHLNLKRPITTRREDFYLQADAFAVLSELDFVGIDGAVQTIEKLLRNTEKRAAAITTLGKTVEKCRDKLAAANQAFVAKLFAVLDGVAEQQFQYDIDWINTNMQRSRAQPAGAPQQQQQQQQPQQPGFPGAPVAPPAAAPVAAPQPAPAAAAPTAPRTPAGVSLAITSSFHTAPPKGQESPGTFFTLGWDPKSQVLISAGRDAPVTVWGTDGSVRHSIDCPGMYICCLDVELQNELVLMCGMFEPPGHYKSSISIYDGRPGQGFAVRGTVMRPDVDMTAVVRALPATSHLVAGETLQLAGGAMRELISMYDLARITGPDGAAGSSSEPLQVFQDHKSLVTCLAPIPGAPNVFVSGSRDCSVKLWDARSGPSALFTFGVPQGDFAATTHAEMVTCVDVAGEVVVSGSLDQSVAAWDLRLMSSGGVRPMAVAGPSSPYMAGGQEVAWTNHGILKACLEGSPFDKLAAVSTLQGLFTIDFSAATPVIAQARAYVQMATGATAPKQYNDMKWGGGGRLYASAGEGLTVDVLELLP